MSISLTNRKASIIGGIAYLVMTVLAVFAEYFIRQELWIPGDAVNTATNILENALLFKGGILSYIIVFICDIIVAWVLYVILFDVNQYLALLSAWLRIIYAAIAGIMVIHLVDALQYVTESNYEILVDADVLQFMALSSLDRFDYGWAIGMIFFSLHIFLLGWLIINAGFIPKWIGVLLMIGSVYYFLDNAAKVLLEYSFREMLFLKLLSITAIIGEISLMVWLLFKGGRDNLLDRRI